MEAFTSFVVKYLRKLLFPEPERFVSRAAVMGRAVCWVLILWYLWPCFTVKILDYAEESPAFMHLINLVFHEAGHPLFGIFGWDLLMYAGGSLMQVLVPFLLIFAFWIKNKDTFAAGLFVVWTGQSLTDVAPYINDSRILQMQLLGGGTGREREGHDWEFILNELGWIEYDGYIGRWVLLAGRIIMATGFVWALLTLVFQWIYGKGDRSDGSWNPDDDKKLMEYMAERNRSEGGL